MKRRGLLWLPFAAFLVLLGVVLHGLARPADHTVYSHMVGQPLPAFTLPPMLPGRPGVASAASRTRPRLVNIFASWCVPCAAEAPQLISLARAGVPIDAVAVRDTPEAVEAFLRRNGDPYRAVGDDREARVQLALGSSGVPESFVVDASGRIVDQHVGEIRAEDVAGILLAVREAR